jgi:hypothetical protein
LANKQRGDSRRTARPLLILGVALLCLLGPLSTVANASPAETQYEISSSSAAGPQSLGGLASAEANSIPSSLQFLLLGSGLSTADKLSLAALVTSKAFGVPPAPPLPPADAGTDLTLPIVLFAIAAGTALLAILLGRRGSSGRGRAPFWIAALAAAAALGAGVVLALVPAGDGAPDTPPRFWGVTPQSDVSASQFARLARGGVETVRFPVPWSSYQGSSPAAPDFTALDAVVAAAAKSDISVLPFVYSSPSWVAASYETLPVSTSAQRSAWTSFLEDIARRYGPGGAFWKEHPELPQVPITAWQIWNEPNFFYFVAHPDAAEYGKLVEISDAALSKVDPGAQVVLGGLFGTPRAQPPKAYSAVDFLRRLYRSTPGIERHFDAVALHPYVADYRDLPPLIDAVRKVMRDAGDGGKDLWLTEFGWGSAPSGSSFEVGPQGQVDQMRGAFRLLTENQGPWRLKRIYWFSVGDQTGSCNFCDSSGLFTQGFRPKPAWAEYASFAGGDPG